ncbi:uncharacterized protein LOC110811376 [Carica papaya]|uniref:uncharacterized protein LOC110811376 n=1 Tax=Carica papaya TaxID=3649 RepID=UPI000B8C9445|nr:uncharacterized protein LOC110811376 [Carica papaya]
MVLWEITLGTAYFLGLKRTYRLALKIQRRIFGPRHPKIRQFVRRRTRAVFDVALKVHQNIQQRDIEVGRNLGNWILRWLDRMKPSAQIRGSLPEKPPGTSASIKKRKELTKSSHLKNSGCTQTSKTHESDRHMFTSSTNIWHKSFPTISMAVRPPRPAGSMTQYRHLYSSGSDMRMSNYIRGGFQGVVREDIVQWMLRN